MFFNRNLCILLFATLGSGRKTAVETVTSELVTRSTHHKSELVTGAQKRDSELVTKANASVRLNIHSYIVSIGASTF